MNNASASAGRDSQRSNMRKKLNISLIIFLTVISSNRSLAWGFYAHRLINYHAVFTLPQPMISFFKKNIEFIKERSVVPDKRRYTIEGEAKKHYLDMDYYRKKSGKIPLQPKEFFSTYSQEEIEDHGTLPWTILQMKERLVQAFRERNSTKILKLAADLGHYIGDANVPLHTTSNYDGQETCQEGIHAFWESRLPELFSHEYSFIVGKAEYINNIQKKSQQRY